MLPIKDTALQKADLVKVFNSCRIDDDCGDDVDLVTKSILLHKDLYQQVQDKTTVPWYVVGIIHNMECSLNFKLGLHCGSPWNKVTHDVPKGRGPFNSWLDAAIDALHIDGLDKVVKWDLATTLYEILKFNGLGCYVGAGIHSTPPYRSAYLWSFTDAYEKGKYVADGSWDPDAESDQVGAAAILLDLINQKLVSF